MADEILLENISTGSSFIVRANSTVGRDRTNELIVDSEFVSRFHCKIFIRKNEYYVKDLRSRNGTFINSEKADGEMLLKSGDFLSFGSPDNTYRINIVPRVNKSGDNIFMMIYMSIAIVFVFTVMIIIANGGKVSPEIESIQETKSHTAMPNVRDIIVNVLYGLGERTIDEEAVDSIERYVNYYSKSITYKTRMKNMKKYESAIYDVLKSYNLQEEYIFIAFVESGFDPLAHNRSSGARGMWQFMVPTARAYGLKVNRHEDQRTDFLLSTEAAAKYLTDMAAIFGYDSFLLVAASYNSGDGRVRAALRQIKDVKNNRSFFYLYRERLLPQETREYVLKILAAIVLTEYNRLTEML
jgi:membrane-bound lytic murein transglycosylase D